MAVVTRAAQKSFLAALVATGGPLAGATCHLFINDIAVSERTALADLTEASFTGYAASGAVVWGSPRNEVGAGAAIDGDLKTFSASGTPTPQSVVGYYLASSGTTPALLYVERFDAPVVFAEAGDVVRVLPTYALPNAA
jgi:hypothetical protein